MARYRKVSTNIWDDKNVQKMSHFEKLIFAFFLTNSATTESGVYEVTPITVSQRLNIPLPTVDEILQRQFTPNLTYDFEKNIVFVHRFRRHNAGGRPVIIDKSIAKDMREFNSDKCWILFKKEYPDQYERSLTVNQLLANGCITDKQPISSTSSSNSTRDRKKEEKKKKKWDADAWKLELAIIADYSNILPQCAQLNNPLKTTTGQKTLTAIRIRSKEREWRGNAHWAKLFERCSRSEFLMSGSWFNLPWIVNPTNMEKIEMGNYVEKTGAIEDKPKPVFACSRPGCDVQTDEPWHKSGDTVYCSKKCQKEAKG